jgi:excisionase family DNA binding protein
VVTPAEAAQLVRLALGEAMTLRLRLHVERNRRSALRDGITLPPVDVDLAVILDLALRGVDATSPVALEPVPSRLALVDPITTGEASRMLAISSNGVRAAVARGHLPAHRRGRVLWLERADVVSYALRREERRSA